MFLATGLATIGATIVARKFDYYMLIPRLRKVGQTGVNLFVYLFIHYCSTEGPKGHLHCQLMHLYQNDTAVIQLW